MDNLLELTLFEVQRYFSNHNQYYLEFLYKTLFAFSYNGMFRACELTKTESGHAAKACNVHIAGNKEKIMVALYTSKTHSTNKRLQKIKIESNSSRVKQRHFCPFVLAREYCKLRGTYKDCLEQFFIFHDKMPVTADNTRNILNIMLDRIGLDRSLYGMHSFRIGPTSDLVHRFM